MFFLNPRQNNIFMGSLSHGTDLLEELTEFCVKNSINAGWINVIGAVSSYTAGYYNQESKKYHDIKSSEKDTGFEIASCSGNVSIKDSKPFVHIHAVFTDKDGNSFGGHVMKGTRIFAAEFMAVAFEGEDLVRFHDEETGLFLWK